MDQEVDGGKGIEEGEDGLSDFPDEDDPEKLEQEAEVLLTHAARKRAEVTKNRGFAKKESDEERSARIKEMKERMPCAACKAAGVIAYGHWHSDPSCPQKAKQKTSGPTFIVTQDGDRKSVV